MRFCYPLDELKQISHAEFERLNCLPVTYWNKAWTQLFQVFNRQFPNYLHEAFDVATESKFQLRFSFQKLKYPFRKTNNGLFTFYLFILVQIFGAKPRTDSSVLKILRRSNIIWKKHPLNEIKNFSNSFWFYSYFQL